MAKRNSKAGGSGVSLFPFLSILCCLIGLLTLMIKIISDIKAMERGQNQEEIARALDHQKLRREIEKQKEEQAKVLKELEDKGAVSVEMHELENKRIVLRKNLAEVTKTNPTETDVTLQRQVENLLKQIEAMIKERPPLDEKIAALLKELEERKIDAAAKPPPVVVQPRGTGADGDTNLFFVECNADGIVLRGKENARTSVSKAALTTEPAFTAFLNEAKADRKAMILFLIRTDGNDTYLRAAGWAESQFGLRTAKLPIPNKGDIDLSKFTR